MKELSELLASNRRWAEARRQQDPGYFSRLCGIQMPSLLWIGCADSRVPANQIVDVDPGQIFVHRNVANVAPVGDVNFLSVLQYAIDTLKIEHVVVCGHYGCGGIQAALGPPLPEPLETWIGHLRRIRDAHAAELAALASDEARWRRLCELNVIAQVRTVCGLPTVLAAWQRGQSLDVHGWIYDLQDGLLHDLGVSVEGPASTGP